ncbi:hypothetical protein V6N13_048516 [Hibiscus sabdariffa]
MLGGVCARQSHHIAHPRYSAGNSTRGQESVYEKSLDDNRSPSFFIQKGFSPSTLCLEAGFEEEKLLSTPKPLGRILPHVVLTSGPTFLFLCLISLKSLAPSRSVIAAHRHEMYLVRGGRWFPGHSPFRKWPFSPWSIGWSVQGQKLEHIDSARSRPMLQGLSLGVVSTPYCRAAKLTLVH